MIDIRCGSVDGRAGALSAAPKRVWSGLQDTIAWPSTAPRRSVQGSSAREPATPAAGSAHCGPENMIEPVAALFRHFGNRYTDPMKLTRITVDPGVCTGKPCIRGLRFPVARLLGLLAAGSRRDLNPHRLPLPRAGGHRRGPAVCRLAGGGRNRRIGAVKFLVDHRRSHPGAPAALADNVTQAGGMGARVDVC
jgi:hypothetical protein